MNAEHQVWEIPLAAGASALLFTALLALPLAGSFALPLAAVPIVRVAHRRGGGSGLLGSLLATAAVFAGGLALGGSPVALGNSSVVALSTAPAALFSGLVRRGANPSHCYLGLCLSGFALVAGALLASSASPQLSAADEVSQSFDRMIPAAMDAYHRAGMDAISVERLKGTLEAAREFSRKFLLGLLGSLWALASAITFYAGARSARPAPSAEATRFESLRLPAVAVVLFVVTGATFALLPSPGSVIAGNLLLPLATLFFVAGLSIICHFARRWVRARILRVVLYALAVYFPISLAAALLGLFDWFVDFRRRSEGAVGRP